ncbi:MAG: hypothetical protein H8D56_05315 [Planctomycetes bacterium]|nr:hypothetical protein [Planctomycetota bacterium]
MAGKAAEDRGRRTVGVVLDFGECRISNNENRLFVSVFLDVNPDVLPVGLVGIDLV